eukprot:gene34062-44010_t
MIELISDGLLLLSSLCIVLVASILLERGSKFDDTSYDGWTDDAPHTYYTIGTFYSTYKQTSPVCLDPELDPTHKIRASLGMMYLAVFSLALCFLNPQGSSAKAQGLGMGAEGEEFRALPLPTRDDEETV